RGRGGGRPVRRRARAGRPPLGSARRPTRRPGGPMSKWLSQEWLDETRKLAESQPERPGASARMQYVVTGGADGDVKYYWVLENGKLKESKLGDLPDAEVTLTQTYDDALKIQKGEL